MSINIAAVAATTTPSSSSFPSSSPPPPICLQQQQQTFEHQIHNQSPPQIPHPSEQLCYVHCSICDTVLAVSVPSASLFKMVTVRCGHCSNLLPVNMRAMALIHPPLPSHDPHQQQQQFHFPPNLSPAAGTGVTAISTNAVTNTTAIGSAPSSHSSFLDEIQSAGASNFPPSLITTSHQINGNNNFIVTTTNMAGGVGSGNSSTTIAHNQDHLFIPRQVAAPPVVNRPPEKRQRVPSAYNRFIKDEIQRIKAGNPDITHRQAFSAAAKNWAHFPHIHFGLMPGHHHHHAIRKTNICPQEGDDMIHMKDGFLASANVGVLPY